MGPLSGLKVIDLTSILMGPYATQYLGDYGADVVKVEPPKGDLVREIRPGRTRDLGGIFLNANRSKRSVVLDLKAPEGREALLALCEIADIIVYNVRPAAMARLGLAYEDVAAVNPSIIYAGLFGFGQDGPYAARPAYDDLIQGGSTLSHLFQRAGNPDPLYVPAAIADRIVGLTALGAILAAVVERQKSGQGQRVDIPMFETMVSFVLGDHLGGKTYDPPLDGGGYKRHLAKDRRPYRTADGHVCALVYTDDHWRRFLKAVGEEDRLEHPSFATFSARLAHVEEVYGWLGQVFETRPSAEWIALLDEIDVPVMAMHDLDSIMEDPHLKAVGFFEPREHPREGRIFNMANPVSMSRTPVAPERLAPGLGEHSRAVLREAGFTDERIDALAAKGVVIDGSEDA